MSGWFVEVLTSTGLDNCLHFRASFTSDVLRVFHSLSRTSDGKIVIISYHSICNFQGAVKSRWKYSVLPTRLFYQPVETKMTFDLKSLVNFF